MDETLIAIEVAYATDEQQVIVALNMPVGSTAEQAIQVSGLLNRFPEIAATDLNVGIFGSVCKLAQPLRQADRVEIYRPLIHDPEEARRQRAVKV